MNKTLKINMNKCDGDGGCLNHCPNQVFELREITTDEYDSLKFLGKFKTKIKGRVKSFAVNVQNCVECGLCIEQCHERAIQFVVSEPSPFSLAAVRFANGKDPFFDQPMPLCFCRFDTIRSLVFSPIALELHSPGRFSRA